MNEAPIAAADRAATLRSAFDRTFAEAPPAHADAEDELFGIMLSDTKYAVRLSEVSALYATKKVTQVPACPAAMLGVAGFRGEIMPVFDLAMILGHPRSETARWMFVAAQTPIALAFDAFDGHLRIPHAAIVPAHEPGLGRFVSTLIQIDRAARPVIDTPAVIKHLSQGLSEGG